jgi:hypothetical protein
VVEKKAIVRLRTLFYMVAALAILAVAYIFLKDSEPDPVPATKAQAIWSVEMLELSRVSISLSSPPAHEAWVKRDDQHWYFDEPEGPRVRQDRWGGGIPLILSGPNANRIITTEATHDQLEAYGLVDPRMKIDLLTEKGEHIEIEVGDTTPNGQNYYVRLAQSAEVYGVDFSWHNVLEQLVTDPPYPEDGD